MYLLKLTGEAFPNGSVSVYATEKAVDAILHHNGVFEPRNEADKAVAIAILMADNAFFITKSGESVSYRYIRRIEEIAQVNF